MNITPLENLTYNSTNLTEDTTPSWIATSGYAVDTIRQLNTKLYKSLDLIHPLCDYIYDGTDPLRPHYTVTAIDGVEVADNTAVPCVQDTTVVYVVDDGNYYKYKNQADANIDFTAETLPTPTNFNLLTAPASYRHDVYNPETTPLKWQDLGYTNKYKCLDQSLSSQTEKSGDITMSFIVNKIDSVYLFRVSADSVTIKVTQIDTSTVLYDETTLMSWKTGATWYDYFFTEYTFRTKLFSKVPLNYNCLVEITISSATTAKVGLVGIGRSNYVGGTLYGSSISMLDFSTKITNKDGETYIQEGNYKIKNNLNIDVPVGLTDVVFNKLVEYRAIPVVFQNDVFDSMVVFGTYKNFDLVVSTPTVSKMSIEIESLI